MSIETSQYAPSEQSSQPRAQSNELLNEETGESIFKYYNIDNEVRFIQNYDLPPSQKEFYLKENVKTFLAEFAGKVPFKRITYILRNDGLYYGNIRAVNNYLKTANRPEATSREKAEGNGFEQIDKGFVAGSSTACWISPPKIANYGFVFHLVKDDEYDEEIQGHKVTEYIIRYDEKMHEVRFSNQISSQLGNKSQETAEDFIRNPTFGDDASEEVVGKVLNAAGKNNEDIKQSRLFDDAVNNKLSPMIEQYVDLITRLSTLAPQSWEYTMEEINAKELLVDLFKQAKVLKHIISDPQNFTDVHIRDIDPTFLAYQAQSETAEVQGGGSCPSVRRSKGDIFSPTSIFELMNAGSPFESKLPFEVESEYYDDYYCPDCPEPKKPIPGEKKGSDPSTWRIHCPHCNSDTISCGRKK